MPRKTVHRGRINHSGGPIPT